MKLSCIVAAAALAFGSQMAAAAGGPLDLSSGTAGFASTPIAGGFAEMFTFSLASAGTLTGSVTSVVSGTQDVDFTAIYVTGPSGVLSFSQLLPDPFETYILNAAPVVAGNYTLTLIGTNSASIASYGGNLGFTSQVPEPETYALLAAGMLGMGIWSRRRVG